MIGFLLIALLVIFIILGVACLAGAMALFGLVPSPIKRERLVEEPAMQHEQARLQPTASHLVGDSEVEGIQTVQVYREPKLIADVGSIMSPDVYRSVFIKTSTGTVWHNPDRTKEILRNGELQSLGILLQDISDTIKSTSMAALAIDAIPLPLVSKALHLKSIALDSEFDLLSRDPFPTITIPGDTYDAE